MPGMDCPGLYPDLVLFHWSHVPQVGKKTNYLLYETDKGAYPLFEHGRNAPVREET